MPLYYVVTPAYRYADLYRDDPDVVRVEAKNKREAKVKALRKFRTWHNSYVNMMLDKNENPFVCMTVLGPYEEESDDAI